MSCCTTSRLRKKSATGLLARHRRLTISAAFENVTRYIQCVVNLRRSMHDREWDSPLSHRRLTDVQTWRSLFVAPWISLRPCSTASLRILRAILADRARKLIAAHYSIIEFFRRLLIPSPFDSVTYYRRLANRLQPCLIDIFITEQF